ncbi:hypothetical protein KC335_g24 [Hortaea werneckii]|nr:hypothetical protein KC335_g24 [Hortaea werneckii]
MICEDLFAHLGHASVDKDGIQPGIQPAKVIRCCGESIPLRLPTSDIALHVVRRLGQEQRHLIKTVEPFGGLAVVELLFPTYGNHGFAALGGVAPTWTEAFRYGHWQLMSCLVCAITATATATRSTCRSQIKRRIRDC